jgi:hypothetical protein
MSKLGRNDMKAYFSYNQASFPRSVRGEFYAMFENMTWLEILNRLHEVDGELGLYSHPTICLWHTALNYLFEVGRCGEAETISSELAERMLFPKGDLMGLSLLEGQLNFDASKTMYLLGRSKQIQAEQLLSLNIDRTAEGTAKRSDALTNLQSALNLRHSRHRQPGVSRYKWDPLTGFILETLKAVGNALHLQEEVETWDVHLQAMRTA